MIEIINAAFHSKDVNRIKKAIGDAAKAQNVAEVARRAGIARPSVYRAFDGEGVYPNMTTVGGYFGSICWPNTLIYFLTMPRLVEIGLKAKK